MGRTKGEGLVSEKCLLSRFTCLFAAFPKAAPLILEPVMSVEVNIPQEFQVSELKRHRKYSFKAQMVANYWTNLLLRKTGRFMAHFKVNHASNYFRICTKV